ncbi:hypothetical protein [Tautonia rosea]|uniref:hypothetical protein n=1 Tax=Tautonia rosea TaxID=2728037 RepID=UPI001473E036|nr:hypothetical protein [Tautonia rosea]
MWKKATSIRSVDRETYNALPDSITVRKVRFRVEQLGFRTRSVVVTTILDPEQASAEELASLYRARWNNELDLRSIKVTLQMDRVRLTKSILQGLVASWGDQPLSPRNDHGHSTRQASRSA